MQHQSPLIPKNMRAPLILALAFNCLTYYGSRLLTSNLPHYNLTSRLDEQIPVIPWTVAIYLGSYVFWAANYVIGSRQNESEAFRLLSADFAAKFVCLICFLVFPTTNTRPAIEGSSVWALIMRALYRADAADNLFPSIHCLTSWFCVIAVRKNPNIPVWYRGLSLAAAAAICVSTLTTRQHVIIDVIAGVGLAEISYQLAERTGFTRRYRSIILRITEHRKGGSA